MELRSGGKLRAGSTVRTSRLVDLSVLPGLLILVVSTSLNAEPLNLHGRPDYGDLDLQYTVVNTVHALLPFQSNIAFTK